jgi:alpha-1,3-mannosyltransferase
VGGIEKVVEGLSTALIERGHQSDVACLDTCAYTKDKLPAFDEYEGIKVHRFSYLNLRFYKMAPGVIRLLKDYDLVHVHGMGFFSDFLGLAKPFHKKPLVLNTHGGFFHTRKIMWLKKLYLIWNIIPLRFFEKVIADSRSDEVIYSKISPDIEHIPNGIPNDVFQVKRNPGPYTLLYVGRISKNKRVDCLIETLAELKDTCPEIKLKIVGEDWEGIQKNLEALSKSKGVERNIEFLGKVEREELLENLSTATFMVSASDYEGFGVSVLEAMAAGCPTVVNDIPAFREFVEDGKNGFLVDFASPKSAASQIQGLFETDLDSIVAAGKKTADKYSWNEIIGVIENLYTEILRL